MSKEKPVKDVADCRSVFSHFFLFVLPMQIVGLVTVDHVVDDGAIVVVLYWWTSVWAKTYLSFFGSVLLCTDKTSPSCLVWSFWFLKGKKLI